MPLPVESAAEVIACKARSPIALILPLLRQHKLHIVRFAASGKAHSFRCASFPMGVRFAGSPIGFPPQAALANVPDREAADGADEKICTNSVALRLPQPVCALASQ